MTGIEWRPIHIVELQGRYEVGSNKQVRSLLRTDDDLQPNLLNPTQYGSKVVVYLTHAGNKNPKRYPLTYLHKNAFPELYNNSIASVKAVPVESKFTRDLHVLVVKLIQELGLSKNTEAALSAYPLVYKAFEEARERL